MVDDDSALGEEHVGGKSPPDDDTSTSKNEFKPSDVVIIMGDPVSQSDGATVPLLPRIQTATVETVGELDVATSIPTEKVVKATARAVTLTETDVGKE